MIFQKYRDLLKYRGQQPPAWLASDSSFINSCHDTLVKESNEGGLDPFLYKVLANPPRRG